jgi:hypothetical protein
MCPKPRFDPNFLKTLQTLAENPALRQEIPDPPAPKPEPEKQPEQSEPQYTKGQFTEDGKRCLNPEKLEHLCELYARRFMKGVELDPRNGGDSPGDCVEKLTAALFAGITTIEAAFATVAGITKLIHRQQRLEAAGKDTDSLDFREVIQLCEGTQELRQQLGHELFGVLRKYEEQLFAEIQQEDSESQQ